MTQIQEYPILDPLPAIKHHNHLPPTVKELGHLVDASSGHEKTYTLVKNGNHLTVFISFNNLKTHEYRCFQYDYPLKVLSWFPKALEDFRKPPAEGGIHAGGMMSKDVNIDGEMLAVGRTTDGYFLTNWSRNDHVKFGDYDPMEISLSSDFLYRTGFLSLWKSLGEKCDRGQL